jgi:mutator protein MutT
MPAPRPVRHVQAALAIIERRGRCLICRRRPGGFLGGYWEFPGGKREPNESWTACVRRELREELGVRAMRVTPWMRVRRRGIERRPVLFVVFRCGIAGRPRPLAAETLRWVPLTRLGRYRFPPANRPILARLTTRRRPR